MASPGFRKTPCRPAGDPLRFAQSSGVTGYDGMSNVSMDGQESWIVTQRAENGINAASAPLNAMVGIFLDDDAPNATPMASTTDFSSAASRNFTWLSRALKQVFVIGDGLTDAGALQQFVPPRGATRLFLGIMDEQGWWWDNVGTVQTNLFDKSIRIVK